MASISVVVRVEGGALEVGAEPGKESTGTAHLVNWGGGDRAGHRAVLQPQRACWGIGSVDKDLRSTVGGPYRVRGKYGVLCCA